MAQHAPALRADYVPGPAWARDSLLNRRHLRAADDDAQPSGRVRGVRAGTTGVGLALAVASVAAAAPAQAETRDYVVRGGDTVSHIALRTGVSVPKIIQANDLGPTALIRVGQRLTIPSATTSSAPARTSAPAATSSGKHKVVAGDNVWTLAKRYGTTVDAIVKANKLNSQALIRIGQTLTIPGAGGATSTAAKPASTSAGSSTTAAPAKKHTVARGDTVSALAQRYGTTVSAIVKANKLNSQALIRIGQTLTIPGAGGATSSTASSTGTQLVGNTFAGRTYPGTTVAAANANKATLMSMQVPTRAQMQAKVAATARAMGVDPALAQAVAFQESGFNHQAVSPANAIGTMQVIPSSGEWASQLVGRELNLLDPDDNVVAGVAILRQLTRSAPDLPTAIAGYYQGLAGVKKYGMYPDTRRYVANVQTLMTRFR